MQHMLKVKAVTSPSLYGQLTFLLFLINHPKQNKNKQKGKLQITHLNTISTVQVILKPPPEFLKLSLRPPEL
jgi:hypothetical protein